tara:strand:+ start:1725 stop:2393 length:669 start_codon:yes stop_codon:yes gene_type:complete
MSKHVQRETFIQSEGDSYFKRNQKNLSKDINEFYLDFFIPKIKKNSKILEIGCSNGRILNWFQKKLPNYNLELHGIDPSYESIISGTKQYNNLQLKKGTSDNLEYQNSYFDIVLCGCFFYLIDRGLVFKTTSEIDRVLKQKGNLVIVDFDVPFPKLNNYEHNDKIKTYKNDYSKFFTGGGHYSLIEKKPFTSYKKQIFAENINDRFSTSILYKESLEDIYVP